jgi:hypothetical protein
LALNTLDAHSSPSADQIHQAANNGRCWFNLNNAEGVRQFHPRVASTLGKRKYKGRTLKSVGEPDANSATLSALNRVFLVTQG